MDFTDSNAKTTAVKLPTLDRSNIGIVAVECHFPKQFVSQSSLEKYDMQFSKTVKPGKYTIGLGQTEMAFCSDREDVYSLALTCVDSLLHKYDVSKKQIGRLTVSTETIMDHSKSIKSVLMQLFESEDNFDVEGVDMVHACYSGTAALLDAFHWCHSPFWDGRYAIVLACDIAEYAKGNARMTGGAGCVALLIGKDGVIQMTPQDGRCKASHSTHDYDFYKPNLDSPFPVVDGHSSNKCYLGALDRCFQLLRTKYKTETGQEFDFKHDIDAWIFHSPYNKLVQKSFARLLYDEWAQSVQNNACNDDIYSYFSSCNLDKLLSTEDRELLATLATKTAADTVDDRACMKLFSKLSKHLYNSKVSPSTFLPKRIGNCYSASIFCGLVSLIHSRGAQMAPRASAASIESNESKLYKIGLFSYGSGICSTMYCLTVRHSNPAYCAHQLARMQAACDLETRLNARVERSAEYFNDAMDLREGLHSLQFGEEFAPRDDVAETLFEDAYYLERMDASKRRFYKQHVTRPANMHKALLLVSQLISDLTQLGECAAPIATGPDADDVNVETDLDAFEEEMKDSKDLLRQGSMGTMSVSDLFASFPKDPHRGWCDHCGAPRLTSKVAGGRKVGINNIKEDTGSVCSASSSGDERDAKGMKLKVKKDKKRDDEEEHGDDNGNNGDRRDGSGGNGSNNGSGGDMGGNNGGRREGNGKDKDGSNDGEDEMEPTHYDISGCAALATDAIGKDNNSKDGEIGGVFKSDMPKTKSMQNGGKLMKFAGKLMKGDEDAIALTQEAVKLVHRADQCY